MYLQLEYVLSSVAGRSWKKQRETAIDAATVLVKDVGTRGYPRPQDVAPANEPAGDCTDGGPAGSNDGDRTAARRRCQGYDRLARQIDGTS